MIYEMRAVGAWQLRVVCFVTFVMWGSGRGGEDGMREKESSQ